MIFRGIALVSLMLVLPAAPADAQRRGMAQPQRPMMQDMGMMSGMMGHGMMDQDMMQMMGQGMGLMATGGPGPAMILRMREALELDQEQVRQLEQIQSRIESQPMTEAAMQAHARAQEALAGESPDFEGYEAALREVADAMVRMHVELARASQEARQVLSEEQRATLDDIQAGMMGGSMMGPGGG